MKHLLWVMGLGSLVCTGVFAEPLRVCATVPDLGDLAREIGGDEVVVTVFARGPEDPHFVDARPGLVKALSQADLYLEIGLELEIGYAPVLLQGARNPRVLPGAPGHFTAADGVEKLDVPTAPVDRSMGDVHPGGSPHFLLDPMIGREVADRLCAKLVELRPDRASYFEQRRDDFHRRLDERMAGWRARLAPFAGAAFVADHNLWSYFAKRFGLECFGLLEPKPGLAPTTRHLADVVRRMNDRDVRVLVSSPYFDPRHARFVAERTGATVVKLAHQVGALPGTATYLDLVDFNVQSLAEGLKRAETHP